MINLDSLLEEAYWGLRKVSILKNADKTDTILLRDTYSLLNNIETMYTLDSSSFFKNDIECKTYYLKYVKPLMYTLKIVKKLNASTQGRKTMLELARLYALYVPCISVFQRQAAALELPEPSSYDYEISEKWENVNMPITKFDRDFVIVDWRLKHERDYCPVRSNRQWEDAHRKPDNKRKPGKKVQGN